MRSANTVAATAAVSTAAALVTVTTLLIMCASMMPRPTTVRPSNTTVIMETRRIVLEQQCSRLRNKASDGRRAVHNMLIDTKHSLSWCPVFKAGSSVWMKGFVKMAGDLDASTHTLLDRGLLQWDTVAKRHYSFNGDIDRALASVMRTRRFLVARHPFERILSAYRDKLEQKEGRDFYFRRYGMHIVHAYRRRHFNQEPKEPTFTEFLRFLVTERYFDEHWSPIHIECEPCTIKYDYIIKMETFEEDCRYMLNDLKLHTTMQLDFKRTVMSTHNTDKTLIKKYYSQVPKQLLRRVYELYRHDFELFGYSSMEYFQSTYK